MPRVCCHVCASLFLVGWKAGLLEALLRFTHADGLELGDGGRVSCFPGIEWSALAAQCLGEDVVEACPTPAG